MPNGVRWVQIAIALTRIGAVLVPLSTLLTGPELVAQLRGRPRCSYLIAVEEFRGHRYLDGWPDWRICLPYARSGRRANCRPPAATRTVDRWPRTVAPADPMLIMFTSGSSGPPKGVIHSHGNALAAVRSGLSARCIDADTRLYLPMPFFWVGGFGSRPAVGAARGRDPGDRGDTASRRTPCGCWSESGSRLFRGWPDSGRSPGTPCRRTRRRSLGVAAGQSRGAAAAGAALGTRAHGRTCSG